MNENFYYRHHPGLISNSLLHCSLSALKYHYISVYQLDLTQNQVYWIGPILGAILAGMFYEFIFNPTRKSSLCYRPKLFRLSAQDMAKVGSKSRSNQQQQLQRHQAAAASAAPFHPSTNCRPQNWTPQHPQTSRSSNTNNPLASPGPQLKLPWEQQHLIANSTSVAHLQSSYPASNTFDQMNFLTSQQQHQQQQQHLPNSHHQTANFDRIKSTAIINSIAQKHQSTINIPQNRNNPDLGKSQSNSPHRLDSLFLGAKPSFSEL